MANDESLPNPVLQVKQERKSSDATFKNFIGEFGAKAENVQITLEDDSTNPATIIEQCSLLDFFKNWEDFKTNNAFMYHGEATNLENQVKFWYGDNGYKITQQPQDVEITSPLSDDLKAVFTVETNVTPTKYQWYVSDDQGKTWTASTFGGTGYNTKTYTLTVNTITRLKRQLKCLITFPNATKEWSNVVKIIDHRSISQ